MTDTDESSSIDAVFIQRVCVGHDATWIRPCAGCGNEGPDPYMGQQWVPFDWFMDRVKEALTDD